MKHDVFISHAHKDKSIANAICGKLEEAGLQCWITTRDVSVREEWTEAARKAIESSRVIVLILSENANAAPHLEKEIAHAFRMHRVIIPFRLGETLPRREILFYLGNVPSCDAPNPPTKENLEELATRIKVLIPDSAGTGHVASPQSEGKGVVAVKPSDSWFGTLEEAAKYRTLGILKWAAITTFFCAVVLFLWFALRQTTEWASLAENHNRSIDRDFSVSPTPLPQARGDALEAKQTPTLTRFGLWQGAESSPTPLFQGTRVAPANTPSTPLADATPAPQRDVTPIAGADGVASAPRPRQLPSVAHRVSGDHHPQFPGTQVKEARRIADLENQRYSLRSQLKETEEKLQSIQSSSDLVTSQRDELQARLRESEKKTQITQKNADLLARELAEIRDQLKEAESRALTAEKNEELVSTERDALQIRLRETENEAETAQKNADLVTRQRDALQTELSEVTVRAQRAEADAILAAGQREALEAELKKKEAGEVQGKNAQLNQPSADRAGLADSAPDTESQKVRPRAQPVHENGGYAKTQPPNPGQNAKTAPLTQALNSSVQPAGPSSN